MKFVNIFIISMFLIAVVLLGWIYFVEIKSNGSQCTLSPLTYGFRELQESNRHQLQCGCDIISNNPSQKLRFNETDQWIENPIAVRSDVSSYGNVTQIFGSLNFSK